MGHFMAILRPIGRCFVAGVFAVLPLVITVAVVIWVAGFVGRLIGPGTAVGTAVEKLGVQFSPNKAFAYTVGWVGVLGVIFLLGVFVQIGAKRLFKDSIDRALRRVPLMGGVYGTAKQLVEMMDKKSESELKGMSVVYCVFGKETGAMFLALMPTRQAFHINGIDYHAVLVPTAPVPVGGSLFFVPVDSVVPANLSVDAFMSIYVSMGVSGPQFLPMPTDLDERPEE
jgi:uncharacterized membrane protein